MLWWIDREESEWCVITHPSLSSLSIHHNIFLAYMSHTSCELNIDISFNDTLLWLKISCSRAFLNSTAFTHTHIHTYSHTHISTYTHIHIHVHIHTHTHIYTYRFKLKQTMRYLTFAFAIQGARFEAQAEAHGSKNDISHFWSRSRVKHKIIFIHCTYFLYIAS